MLPSNYVFRNSSHICTVFSLVKLRPWCVINVLNNCGTTLFKYSKSYSTTKLKTTTTTGMETTKQVVALLACGSFNPITNMHLRMFECAKNYINSHCSNIFVKYGRLSPVSDGYGKPGLLSSRHRLKMIELSVSKSDWIDVLDWEAKQPCWTPTKLVIKKSQEILEQELNYPIKVMLLCGGDLLESFSKKGLWRDEDIHEICSNGIVVVCRPGFNSESYISESPVLSHLKDSIHIVHDIITNDTSSTAIRKALYRGQSVKYLIPDPTLDYVLQNKLYSEDLSQANSTELAPYAYNKSLDL